MKIKNIHIENVLSYGESDIKFDDKLNIFVGANGSGKSNLLNILIFAIKRYCFQNFSVDPIYNSEWQGERRYSIHERYPLFNTNEKKFLAKHKLMPNKPQKIVLGLEIEKGDLDNFNEAKKHQSEVIEFVQRNTNNIQMFDAPTQITNEEILKFFNIAESGLASSTNIDIKIGEVGGVMQILNDQNSPAMIYMRYLSLVRTILDLQAVQHKIGNPFIFFEAYRNNSQETTIASITTYNQSNYTNTQSMPNMSNLANLIGYSGTYITMATKKFGEMYRLALEEDRNLAMTDNSRYRKLLTFFEKFGNNLELKCIDPLNNLYQFYIKKDDSMIPIDAISSGEREILNFLFGLFLDEIGNNVIVIDEPELHLHPKWQKQLINILRTEATTRNIQIFIATHSADFISYDMLNNIFKIDRKDGGSACYRIEETFQQENDSARKKLAVINATNNGKIFFANYVILVEGITDEIVFRKILKSEFDDEGEYDTEGIEIVNVGGKGNFKNFEQVIDALNIPKSRIADYDHLKEFKGEMSQRLRVIEEREMIESIGEKNKKEVTKDFLKSLELFCKKTECDGTDELRNSYRVFRGFFEKIKKERELDENERKEIYDFIEKKYSDNIYILKKGEIENYLDKGSPGNKELAFKRAVEISEDGTEYQRYKTDRSAEFAELKNILTMILEDKKQKDN